MGAGSPAAVRNASHHSTSPAVTPSRVRQQVTPATNLWAMRRETAPGRGARLLPAALLPVSWACWSTRML